MGKWCQSNKRCPSCTDVYKWFTDAFKWCTSVTVMSIVVSGVAFAAAPYGLVSVLNKLEGTTVCWENNPCSYQKMLSDGVLPRVIVNILNNHPDEMVPPLDQYFYHYLQQSNVVPCVDGVDDPANWDDGHHPPITRDIMKRCELRTPINTLTEATSGKCFQFSLFIWGASRIWHDLHALRGCSQPTTVRNSLLSLLALAATLMFSGSWSMGACELFYSKLDDDKYKNCGCYFRLDVYHAVPAALVPLTLMLHLRSKCRDICCEALNGPYLVTLKQHVPLRLTQDRASGPTGTLLLARGLGSGRTGPSTTATTSTSGKPSHRSLQYLAVIATACQAVAFWWAGFTVVDTLAVQVLTAAINGVGDWNWVLWVLSLVVVVPSDIVLGLIEIPVVPTWFMCILMGLADLRPGLLFAAFPSLPFVYDIWESPEDAEVTEEAIDAAPLSDLEQREATRRRVEAAKAQSWYKDANMIMVDDSLAEYDWRSFGGWCCGAADAKEDDDGYHELGGQPEDDETTARTVE